jgi:hypothetical protein
MASKEVLAAMTAINALGTLADLKVVNATLKERWNAIQRQSAAVVAVTIGTGALTLLTVEEERKVVLDELLEEYGLPDLGLEDPPLSTEEMCARFDAVDAPPEVVAWVRRIHRP